MMLVGIFSPVVIVIATMALIAGNIYSTNAFSNYFVGQTQVGRLPKSASRNLRVFAESQFGNQKDEDGEIYSRDTSDNLIMLDWNPEVLLSSDPSMEAMFIPLMNVYDAAASAAALAARNQNADEGDGKPEDSGTPCNAPTILPRKTPVSPVQSLDHDGPLPPSVAPYRMFVREYSRDMGHDGRFTVFTDHNSELPETKGENEETLNRAASLQSDVVFSMDNPLAFIRDSLSYNGSPNSKDEEVVVFIPGLHTAHDPSISREYSNGALPTRNGKPRSSPDRLKYISQVLDGIPMAQIHKGTHIDQGNLDIKLTSDVVSSLLSFGLLSDTFQQNLSLLSMNGNLLLPEETLYRLRATDLDIIYTVLSRARSAGSASLSRTLGDKYLGSDSKGLKDTLIRLIDVAVRSVRETKAPSASDAPSSSPSSPGLVLMTYSATSSVLMAALSEWKNRVTSSIGESMHHSSDDESTKASRRDGIGVGLDESRSGDDNFHTQIFSEEEAELLLHKALTVVTISGLSKGFVDGPAYIHVSMNDDPLTSALGITKLNSEEGGKDAVILQALSPYLIDEDKGDASGETSHRHKSAIYKNDAHNIDSCIIQYLSLVRRINGVTSFREMYNLGFADADSKKLDISQSLFAIDYRSVGQLVIPPHIDCELIPAMIRATGGERWLWNPALQLGEGGVEGFDSPLPSLEYAQAEIENQLGYNTYDEIVEDCCH